MGMNACIFFDAKGIAANTLKPKIEALFPAGYEPFPWKVKLSPDVNETIHEIDCTTARYYGKYGKNGHWPSLRKVLVFLMEEPMVETVYYGAGGGVDEYAPFDREWLAELDAAWAEDHPDEEKPDAAGVQSQHKPHPPTGVNPVKTKSDIVLPAGTEIDKNEDGSGAAVVLPGVNMTFTAEALAEHAEDSADASAQNDESGAPAAEDAGMSNDA